MRRILLMLSAAAAIAVALPALSARAATLTATPLTLASVLASAQSGDTILLATGNYGTFTGAAKAGNVTVQAADGATPTLALNLTSASGLTLRGLTIRGGAIAGTSHDITVAGSTFTDLLRVETSRANAAIRIDSSRFVNLNSPSGGLPARVTVWSGGEPSGVTVSNNLFKGGDADGVRPDADQVQVIGNEFADLLDRNCDTCNHTDPIQIYGGTRAVIRGNWFHQSGGGSISAYIMQADGGTQNVIEDNVFGAIKGGAGGGHGVGYGITLYSDNGSVIEHNTWQQGTCDFNIPCGTLNLGSKSGDPASKGTVIRDNILASAAGTGTTEDHNLFTSGAGRGAGDMRGSPGYVAPFPAAYDDYALAPGSIGRGAASDGLDIGARIVVTVPTPTPTPTATPTASPTPSPSPSPSPTATATPEPTVTPTPDPPYAPACAPDCDATIAGLTADLSDAQAALTDARTRRDALQAKIDAAVRDLTPAG